MLLGGLLLTWFSAAFFALFICWGTDATLQRRPRAIYWVVGAILLFNLFAQTPFFNNKDGLSGAFEAGQIAQQDADDLRDLLVEVALRPGELRSAPAADIYKVVTSTLIHYGWIPVFFNLWFIALFGHVLEGLLGWFKLLIILLLGLVVPAGLEGFLPPVSDAAAEQFRGGAAGIVYALIGAGLVVFPRARCSVATNYDLRFWGILLFILFPITTLTYRAGLPLTEMVILVGGVSAFMLLQPQCGQLWLPLWVVIVYKLVQDLALVEPVKHDIIATSAWRIGGGLFVGVAAGLALDGVQGFRRKWHEKPPPTKRAKKGSRSALASLEQDAQDDPDVARRFLGQRVFVGDTTRTIEFYQAVVMPKFPDLVLPMRDQLALARMLQFKGYDAAALHAYENLLRNYELDVDRWDAYLTAAELLIKASPGRRDETRSYLEKFLEGEDILMRDRVQAEQLLKELGDPDDTEIKQQNDEEEDGTAEVSPGQDNRAVEPENNDAPDTDDKPQVVEAELELVKVDLEPEKKENVATVDFPRLVPRTFDVEDGKPTGAAVRSKARKATESREDALKKYWKPLAMESQYALDDEKLLTIKSRGKRKAPEEQSSGHYSGATLRDDVNETPRRKPGRLAHIEAIKKEFQPFKRGRVVDKDADDRADASQTRERIASNYGVDPGATGADRPKIRLRSEKSKD